MPRPNARQRARYTPEVGRARGELYSRALDRANEALAHGFYLETIALVESLMADRFEAVISLIDGRPARFGTVAEAVRALRQRLNGVPGADDSPLLAAVTTWSTERARWIHEFAKLQAGESLDWDARLGDAARVAREGLTLLREVTSQSASITRAARREASTATGLA